MRANITIEQMLWNPSVMEFFMTSQAIEELNKLENKCNDSQDLFNRLENMFEDVDELSDFLGYEDHQTIINYIGEDLFEEEDDEEENKNKNEEEEEE